MTIPLQLEVSVVDGCVDGLVSGSRCFLGYLPLVERNVRHSLMSAKEMIQIRGSLCNAAQSSLTLSHVITTC